MRQVPYLHLILEEAVVHNPCISPASHQLSDQTATSCKPSHLTLFASPSLQNNPAAVLVTAGTVIALSLSLSLVNTIDKIPVVSDLIELIGIGVTAWFTYRYLTVGPDR